MASPRQLEREIRALRTQGQWSRAPYVFRTDIEARLSAIERQGGPVRTHRVTSRFWGRPYTSYAYAEPWEVIARIGADKVAQVLLQQTDPVGYATWRAKGWREKDPDLSSAYARLADLIDAGALSWR